MKAITISVSNFFIMHILDFPGKITTGELKVKEKKQWKDGVFDRNYELPGLREAETCIATRYYFFDLTFKTEVLFNTYNAGETDFCF